MLFLFKQIHYMDNSGLFCSDYLPCVIFVKLEWVVLILVGHFSALLYPVSQV